MARASPRLGADPVFDTGRGADEVAVRPLGSRGGQPALSPWRSIKSELAVRNDDPLAIQGVPVGQGEDDSGGCREGVILNTAMVAMDVDACRRIDVARRRLVGRAVAKLEPGAHSGRCVRADQVLERRPDGEEDQQPRKECGLEFPPAGP